MTEKRTKLRPREIRFLEEYAKTGDHAQAYVSAGFRAKSREVARVSGYRLLRKIDESMDYREVLEAVGLTDRRVAEIMKELMEHEDPKVRVQALNIATRCLGWQKETLDVPQGAEIVIVRRLPEHTQISGVQPKALPAAAHPVAITR